MSSPRPAGRPRSREADLAILDATLEEFADRGFDALAIERIAARAGVAKTTIYRRYPTKEELVIAAVEAYIHEIEPVDTGDVREDLTLILGGIRRQLFLGPAGDVVPHLAFEVYRRSALGELDRQRLLGWLLRTIAEALQRGVDRGQLRDDIDVRIAAESLMGGLLIEHLLGRLRARGGAAAPSVMVEHALWGLGKGGSR